MASGRVSDRAAARLEVFFLIAAMIERVALSLVAFPSGGHRCGNLVRVTTEPALPPGRGERLLLGGELAGRWEDAGGWSWSAQEVDLDLSDQAAAELDVARAVALVRRQRLAVTHASCDVLRDDARGGLGEYPGLGDGAVARWQRRLARTRQETES